MAILKTQHAITNAQAEGLNLIAQGQSSEFRKSEYAGRSAH